MDINGLKDQLTNINGYSPAVDTEYRGILEDLLLRNNISIFKNTIVDVVRVSPNHVIYKSNNAWRFLKYSDQKGAGGDDLYERVGSDSMFLSDYDSNKATLSSGVYDFDGENGQIRFLKTGKLAQGYYDLADIKSKSESTARADLYTKSTLPLNAENGQFSLVSDGNIDGSSVMAYFENGKWKRITNGSEITNQIVDIYLLAGQSNAHGHALIEYLSEEQRTQDGLFYSSWHQNTSNASSEQHYSSWTSSLVAGSTRGDSNKSTLGGSELFGPEIGFIQRANAINLSDGRSVGILKHAIGASSLTDTVSIVDYNNVTYICIQAHQNTNNTKDNYINSLPEPGTTEGAAYWQVTDEPAEGTWSNNGNYRDAGLSDWDLTHTGDNRGDALRAFKLAIQDGLNKLTNAGYSYRLAGMIWWQGESGATSDGLTNFITHVRDWLDQNYNLDMAKANFPIVITTTTSYWGTSLKEVSDTDAYVGVVDTMEWASPAGATRTLVHPGSDETYKATQADVDAGIASQVDELIGSQDYNDDGVNDMFKIGQAYADQMELAKSGNTNSLWKPDDVELWLDASDTNTTTFSGTNLVSIKDKNSDGSVGSNTFTANGNIVASSINGLQTLTFEDDADDAQGPAGGYGTDYIESSALANSMSSNNQLWFFVINPANLGSDDLDGMFQVNAVTYLSRLKRFYSQNQELNTHASLLPNSEVSILAIQMNWATSGNNGTTSMWIDGASEGTPNRLQDTNTGNPLSSTGTSPWKFMMYNNGQNFLEGQFCEFIATDNLSDREKIEGYLAHRWGIESKLPEDHIYKSSAP